MFLLTVHIVFIYVEFYSDSVLCAKLGIQKETNNLSLTNQCSGLHDWLPQLVEHNKQLRGQRPTTHCQSCLRQQYENNFLGNNSY